MFVLSISRFVVDFVYIFKSKWKGILKGRKSIMEYKGRSLRWLVVAVVSSVILFPSLLAFAGGVNHEPLGAEAFLVGILPPPGFYIKEYLNYYTADKLKIDSGRTLNIARDGAELDRLEVFASSTRFLYISPIRILGGSLGAQMIVP
jgi:hypothetical protein